MNANPDRLPPGCERISRDATVTIRAGREQAARFPDKTFTYDRRVLDYPACARLRVTFVNDDAIRHQWMIHGLPRATYPGGTFNIEVPASGEETGTLILPGQPTTLMVHCGLPQHMQKGMKAAIRVAGGKGLPANIPGATGQWGASGYPRQDNAWLRLAVGAAGIFLGLLLAALVGGWRRRHKGDESPH
jgi:hypothetical protein